MGVSVLILAVVFGGTPAEVPLPTLAPVASLVPSDVPGTISNGFGFASAVQGDYIAVGAPWDPWYNSTQRGAVYVFRRQGNRWIELDKLVVPDAAGDGQMGKSIAMDGDLIVAGAPTAVFGACGDAGHGAAYVFRRDNGGTPDDPWDDTWPLEARLDAPDPYTAQYFALRVAVSGDWVAVSGSCTNTVEVFRRVEGAWRREATLTGSAPEPDDDAHFGVSLDVHGDRIVVAGQSAPDDLSIAIYVFTYRNRQWVEEAKLQAFDSALGNWFGTAVSLHDDQLAIGAPYTSERGWSSGSVYLYLWVAVSDVVAGTSSRDQDGTWLFSQKLISPVAGSYQYFGREVAIGSHALIVGRNAESYDHDGAWAQVFSRTARRWGDAASLSERGGSFPKSVSVDGNFAALQTRIYAVGNLHSLYDYAMLQACFSRMINSSDAADCRAFDLTADGMVDLHDFEVFIGTYVGP